MRLRQLHDMVQAAGPFVSLYMDASHNTEDAAHQAELRWQAMRSELDALGADDRTVSAVGAALLDGPPAPGTAGRAVIAAHGEVLADEPLSLPPSQPVTRFGELPYLVPLLAAARPPVPHVVVVVDRTGGRCQAVDGTGRTVAAELVRGQDHYIHHVAGGGWAHGSIEHRADETVRQNMREVADRVTQLVQQVGARLLVAAGAVPARSDLVAALPDHLRTLATEVDVAAAAIEADPAVLFDTVRRLLAQHEAELDVEAVDRLRAGIAHGTATQGLTEVAEALRLGQVDTLLVTDPVLGDRTVHVAADDRTQVTTSKDGRAVRADEALPVAAVATSADVRVLTGGVADVDDGVAALLRFTR